MKLKSLTLVAAASITIARPAPGAAVIFDSFEGEDVALEWSVKSSSRLQIASTLVDFREMSANGSRFWTAGILGNVGQLHYSVDARTANPNSLALRYAWTEESGIHEIDLLGLGAFALHVGELSGAADLRVQFHGAGVETRTVSLHEGVVLFPFPTERVFDGGPPSPTSRIDFNILPQTDQFSLRLDRIEAVAIPEPGAGTLLLAAACCALAARRRQAR